MDNESIERCKQISDAIMELVTACHDEVGRDYQITREDYELAVVEAYILICSAHASPIRGIEISAKSVVTFGDIFDLIHELLKKSIIGRCNPNDDCPEPGTAQGNV